MNIEYIYPHVKADLYQLHINAIKEQKMPWNSFVELMEDIFYSDMDRLKLLNALILTELTISYSDMERSKYLNTMTLEMEGSKDNV